MRGAAATLLVVRRVLDALEPFPVYSVLVKILAHSMIRNMIHCNDYNSDRSSLAYMYVHVRILLGNMHVSTQANK